MTELLGTLTVRSALLIGLATAVAGALLRFLGSVDRRELRAVWVFDGIGLAVAIAANIAVSQAAIGLSVLFENVAIASIALATLNLIVLVIFQLIFPRIGLTLPRIAEDLTLTGTAIAGALYGLSILGVEPSRLFTTSAILTGLVAFSMQDTLGNVLGGVVLQLDNSLKVGDFVRLDDVSGTVIDVRWRYTAIQTNDREVEILPNSWLMKNRFRVLHPQGNEPLLWRRTVSFNVDPAISPSLVIATMDKAVADSRIAKISLTKQGDTVLMDTAAGYHRYAVRYWLIDPKADLSTDSLVRMHVLAALDRAGIRLGEPLEQRQMVDSRREQSTLQAVQEHARRAAVLTGAALFASLSQEEREALAHHLTPAYFVSGSVLTRQGAAAHWLYLIVQGDADVVVERGAKTTPVSTLHAGDFFGEMGMLTGEPRSATVSAKTDVDCYRLDKEGFASVLLKRPDIAVELSHVLERRHSSLVEVIQQKNSEPSTGMAEEVLAKIKVFFRIGEAEQA